ncbi:MAG: hypothetical protein ABIN01_25200 [Ferruginibacter sp.]
MLTKITILLLTLSPLKETFAQKLDSTANVRHDLLMKFKFSNKSITYNENDSTISFFKDSLWASIFHVDDNNLRKSLFSVTVKEYKNGVKISDENLFTRVTFDQSDLFSRTEDSTCVFSFFRKEIDPNNIRFGYRIPPETITRTYQVNNIESDFIMVLGEGIASMEKVPLNKPFTWLIYTLPIRGKIDPSNPTALYKLGHSFFIDLTIYQPTKL